MQPISPEELKASLHALRGKLEKAYPYSYGYEGAPSYLKVEVESISFRLLHLIRFVSHLETRCPAKFYKPRNHASG